MTQPTPRYAQIKAHILERITSGEWGPGFRVPSENELVKLFQISRMTANRVLNELTTEGYLYRLAGTGTFVRDALKPAQPSNPSLWPNIAEDIRSHGHLYHAKLLAREKLIATPALMNEFEWHEPQPLENILILHCENALPIELECRWFDPSLCSALMMLEVTETTPLENLASLLTADTLEQTVEALMPDRQQQQQLSITPQEPCLSLHRRYWQAGHVVSVADHIYPASRYALYSRHNLKSIGL